jgi:hypothetical protein
LNQTEYKAVGLESEGEKEMANFAGLAVFFIGLGAWIQHLYTCFTEEYWGFLVAGAIFFPVAIVHGIGIWIGIW